MTVIRLLLLVTSAACAIYGICKYTGKKVAMFGILIAAALGCFMMGHLYDFITLLVQGSIPTVFNIGMLARLGGFAFIFSASYAQMDGLVDDKSPKMTKYRLAALLAPALVICLYVPVLFAPVVTAEKITAAFIYGFAALASYFNLKHLIIPDVSFGIISSIRAYSLFALLTAVCCAAMITVEKLSFSLAADITGVLLALLYPCVMIAMERGRNKWIT